MVLHNDNVRLGGTGIMADLLLEALLPQEETYRLNSTGWACAKMKRGGELGDKIVCLHCRKQ